MSLQGKVNRLLRDVFDAAYAQISLSLIESQRSGRIAISEAQLNDINSLIKSVLDANFMKGSALIDGIVERR